MRKLWWLLVLLVTLALALVWWVYRTKDELLASAIRSYGPNITGVSVKLGGVSLSPGDGTLTLKGIELGNPKGFKTAHALVLQQSRLKLDLATLTKDVVQIREISIEQPLVTYEYAAGGSNLDVIQRNVEAYIAANLGSSTQAQDTKKTLVIIEQFAMLGAKAEVSADALQGRLVSVNLPDIHLHDIGKKAGGVTPAEATRQIVSAIRQEATNAVLPLHLGGVMDSIKKGAGSVVDSVKGFFK